MVRGLYIAAAGALVAQADADNIANNLANVSTAGFKSTLLQVQANDGMPIARQQNEPGGVPVNAKVGSIGTGSQIYDTPVSYRQGTLAQTGNTYDFGITGDAFFTIQTPRGIRYTRDGAFVRNAQGILSTRDGNLVLGQSGAVTLPDDANAVPPGAKIVVGADGTITANGGTVDRLRLTSFGAPKNLGKEGANLFFDAGANPQTSATSTVSQGYVENSNSDVVRSIVDLITAQRWFEANQKCIRTQDDATAQAIQQVGISRT